MTAFSYHSCYSPLHLSGPSAQQAFYAASFTEHRGSAQQNQHPPHPPGGGGDTCSHVHMQTQNAHTYLLWHSLLPAGPRGGPWDQPQMPHHGTRQAPCSAVTCNLQPLALEGGWPPPHGPSQRGLKPSVSRGSVCRDKKRGRERGAGESRGPSWRRQQEDHRGAEESHGMRG